MDESFILQTIGRLYLENTRLTALLRELPNREAEIAELHRQVEELTKALRDESNREK